MSAIQSTIRTAVYNATDRSNVELSFSAGGKFNRHTLTISTTGTPSAGTVTVRRKAINGSRWIALTDQNGAAVTISLATNDTIEIDGGLDGLQLDIAGLATATAWQASLSGY